MVRSIMGAAVATLLLGLTGTAFAETSGTAAEAKALLEKAVVAIKADEKKAIEEFNDPKGSFRENDLYVFCAAAPTYNFTSHAKPALVGTPLAALVDKNGKKLGEEIIKTAAEGKIGEVDYMFPRPGGTEPVQKVTFVTKAGNEICGVGYYK